MRLRIIVVGKVRERYLLDGIQEYLKRLGPMAKVEVVNVADEPVPENAGQAIHEQARAAEAARALKALDPSHYVVALDSRGTQLSSEGLAEFLQERGLRGQSALAFVIGGSTGLGPEVLQRADFLLSLGKMTFLHQMVPLILLEQIYRGFKINRGEPYHK